MVSSENGWNHREIVLGRALVAGALFGAACSDTATPSRFDGCRGTHCDAGSGTAGAGGKPATGGKGGGEAGEGGATTGGSGAGAAAGTGGKRELDAGSGGAPVDAGDASRGTSPEGSVCRANFGDCNHRADDGCETNLLGHPDNCGRCGRDCLGGECHDGVCDAIQLSADPAQALAIAGDRIYWTTGDGVRSSSRDGGNLSTLARPEVGVGSLAIAGNDIYWTDLGNAYFPQSFASPGLVRVLPLVNLDGGAPRTLYTGVVQQPLFELIGPLTTDATNVYFEADDRSGSGSAFYKMPLGGGPAKRVFPDAGYLLKTAVQSLRAAKGYLSGAGGFMEAFRGEPVGGWLFRAGVAGGSYEKIWQSDDVAGITLDIYGDYVYFTGVEVGAADAGPSDAGAPTHLRLFRIPLAGGPAEEPWSGGGGLGIVVDATGVYASTLTDVQKFALGGGPPTILAANQSPRVLVTDDKAVYWTNYDDKAPGIWKVAK